ncbi:MAG: class I SAM-dependent methyltransferase, partial [Patescibacteria group bacterium]|nr:class I SAM-dependent methyltransferase [Patescibacteria group bacterium]
MTNLPTEKNWDSFWETNTDSRFTKLSWSKRRIINILDKLLKPGMNVLDAGSGSGFFSSYFIAKKCKVYPLDYSKDALKITRRLTQGQAQEYIQADLLDPELGKKYSKQFDLIFTDGLFEHFEPKDQLKIMGNFKLVKRSNGIIATFVPNKYSWWEVIRPFFMPGIVEVPFTMNKLTELHNGLEIISSGGINVIPLPIS